MQFSKKDLWTIPNILTYIRFLCIPFFVWVMLAYRLGSGISYLYAGFGLFLFASLTDIVDGFIARKFNQISDIGKVIDPIADKVLQVLALVMLVVIGHIHWAFMAFLLIKEVYMAVQSRYFMVKSKRQVEQKSNIWGKTSALVIFVGIVVSFVNVQNYDSTMRVFFNIINASSVGILTGGCLLMAMSAVMYTLNHIEQLKHIKESGILDKLDNKGNPIDD